MMLGNLAGSIRDSLAKFSQKCSVCTLINLGEIHLRGAYERALLIVAKGILRIPLAPPKGATP